MYAKIYLFLSRGINATESKQRGTKNTTTSQCFFVFPPLPTSFLTRLFLLWTLEKESFATQPFPLSLTFPIFKEKFVSGENGHWIKSFRDYTLISIQIILFFYLLELIEFGWSNLQLKKKKENPFLCSLYFIIYA